MKSKAVSIIAGLAIVVGLGTVSGGVAGAVYTSNAAATEMVVTGDDASIPNAEVRGPFTMKAQADNIEKHTLKQSEGLRYAEMDRDNPVRPMWVTATTLRTALHLGMLAYGLAALAVAVGLVQITTGAALLVINKRGKYCQRVEELPEVGLTA